MDLKSIKNTLIQIAENRGIPFEKIVESIEAAIASAYKKEYGHKNQKIKAKLNLDTGEVKFWQVKTVLDQNMIYSPDEQQKEQPESLDQQTVKKYVFHPEKHIMIEEAKKIDPLIQPGQEIEIPLEPKKEYGRIAAQTAKQVILQKIREAEKQTVFSEYKSKEGSISSGIIQRVEGINVFIDLGKTIGILPKDQQILGEFYRPGQRIKVYILKVEDAPKGPSILLSRTYPKLVSKLFELEVPEVAAGTVVIKSIARDPGFRTKIAVASLQPGVDPIGAMVGQRGTRIMAVINELGGEKIDVIQYDEDPEKFIINSLSPAKVLEVQFQPNNKATVYVAEDQFSLAIGREGRNVRLASELTGWKIDVKTRPNLTQEESQQPPQTSFQNNQ